MINIDDISCHNQCCFCKKCDLWPVQLCSHPGLKN